MKKLKLKPIIIATATGATLMFSSVVSAASFMNFMTEPAVDANAELAAKFGTIVSFNKHMLCGALITDAETALDGKSIYKLDADNSGTYFPASTSTVSSSDVTIGSKATDFQNKWHANIIDWTFDKDKMTTCASASTFICSAEEAGQLDTKGQYGSLGDLRTENGANQIRCVLTLGTGCSPSLADSGVVILDVIDVVNEDPSSCAHTISIPGLEVDKDEDGVDADDIESARNEAGTVKGLMATLFQKAGDSVSPTMIRQHVTGSSRDVTTQSTGSDHGY